MPVNQRPLISFENFYRTWTDENFLTFLGITCVVATLAALIGWVVWLNVTEPPEINKCGEGTYVVERSEYAPGSSQLNTWRECQVIPVKVAP